MTNGFENGRIYTDKVCAAEDLLTELPQLYAKNGEKMDIKKNIPEIEKKIKYTFKDKTLLIQAFTRSSFCNEHKRFGGRGYVSNEVLEFFGDSVLSTAIISLLLKEKTERYEHGIYTELDEGDFSNIRSKLSDKRNLSMSMAELGLQRYLQMGEGDEKMGIENEPSVMEDLFESIIGAIYIDCGMNIATVINSVSAMLDVSTYFSEEALPIQSHKNALQEWCADKKHRLPQPIYKTVSESGPDHKRTYERSVSVGDRVLAVGKGKNLKLADAAAAEAALEVLKRESETLAVQSSDALVRIREYAAKKKQPSPEFRDLGESPNSTASRREYIIECRVMGKSATGIAGSKQDARTVAAEKLLKLFAEEEAPKKAKKQAAPKREKAKPAPAPKKPIVKEQAPKSARKSEKSPSPKKRPYQHKKHL